MERHIQQVVDLTEPANNAIHNMSPDEARQRILTGQPEAVRAHDLRHNRYRGLDKTQFQAAWTATAINLKRVMTVRAAALGEACA